jgi:hypothetical protein
MPLVVRIYYNMPLTASIAVSYTRECNLATSPAVSYA